MRRAWGVLASAVIAVALEIAVNLVAESVSVPRRYYLAPVGAFVVLVGSVLTLRDHNAPARGGEPPAGRLSSGRHTIKGRWHEPSLAMVAAIVMVASLCLYLGGLRLVRKTPSGLLIAILVFVVLLAALCLWVALGSRVSLEFSADGVAVRRSLGRKRRLRWDEARNFRTDGRLSWRTRCKPRPGTCTAGTLMTMTASYAFAISGRTPSGAVETMAAGCWNSARRGQK